MYDVNVLSHFIDSHKGFEQIATFDVDGVIFMEKFPGVYPGRGDIIITGRSIDEMHETRKMLKSKGIDNSVFFNPVPFENKTRESSGHHKAGMINLLRTLGINVTIHYEDDPVQAAVISENTNVQLVLLLHNIVERENVRHYE